ncbi:hypothetical protein SDC9_103204 [bioreactor metagenome]|uniref:Uncharacterized protein n=1 Tax=bioreactor metagenome TaxID=1076179 RepID=A0A645AT08_9ZZZZ
MAGKAARLRQQALHGAAAVPPPERGDHAVGAAVVAALGDFQIGRIGGGGQQALPLLVGVVHISEQGGPSPPGQFLQRLHHIRVAACAQQAVHLGQLVENLLPVPLGKTARHQQRAKPALPLERAQL